MTADRLALLRSVAFLAPLDDATLGELIAHAGVARYRAGERIVAALEAGADVFVVVAGHADVVVEPVQGATRVLQTLAPGQAFGEMASLTGELRSATVVATDDVEVMVIHDADFDHLRERRPEVAVALLRTLGKRLVESNRAIDALLSEQAPDAASTAHDPIARGSIRRLWRELVVNHHRDRAFHMLAAFVLTLVVVRIAVYLSFRLDVAPRSVLRAAYMTGFGLVFCSAAAALLSFRPLVRQLVALAYGIGLALIFNELGVTLAFDIFFKDIHTRDPDVAFNVEMLYHRTEPIRAIVIGLVVLIQVVYLRSFYRRLWFIAKTRARRVLARRAATDRSPDGG